MDDIIIPFDRALELSKEDKRTILLGNGFSRSIWKDFNYDSLYEVSEKQAQKKKPKKWKYLKKLFQKLETTDFEKVLHYLNITITVLENYEKNEGLIKLLTSDQSQAKESLLSAIEQIHPKFKQIIKEYQFINIIEFLSNFNQIFTINYDLLLYWIIMESIQSKKIRIPRNDGFFIDKESNNLIWDLMSPKTPSQNVFYLHGNFFITDEEPIQKIIHKGPDNKILDQLKDLLDNERLPLVVLEGKDKKIEKIINHSYFLYCLYSLIQTEGNLFLLGVSLNNDNHLVKAIKKSKVKKIFVGYHEKLTDEFRDKTMPLSISEGQNREIYYFDSFEVTKLWKSSDV
ncbi:TPA: DUF4917 family protein [Legionella pneumophila]|nr:DUF4917 family protein [Legionella pneumophila]